MKLWIDKNYGTRPDCDSTGIGGYSTGTLISIYASLAYPQVISRLIAMSSAVCIWMDYLEETLSSADYSSLKYVDVYVGTNEFGRMTTKEEFLSGSDTRNDFFKKNDLGESSLKYEIFPDAMHTQREWRYRFPDALRRVFQDSI
ncbi:alpha/beta hydrolase-fold protein [Parasphaerochaeta coccoides]|uniref:alpha/beta hydrolase-fold protein n=1 Tax=Parasphaerochaeta coccoides TaxID=273376 RepID=UPI00068AEFE0|nr:alpha/beta hydrolase-fold protein [Parasphaerochaeta coccoides]